MSIFEFYLLSFYFYFFDGIGIFDYSLFCNSVGLFTFIPMSSLEKYFCSLSSYWLSLFEFFLISPFEFICFEDFEFWINELDFWMLVFSILLCNNGEDGSKLIPSLLFLPLSRSSYDTLLFFYFCSF
jgi:hypothetical protein